MGFELGPGRLRRAPRGWLPARAFPLRHSVYDHPSSGPEGGGGETVFDTSMGMSVLWRVEAEGRAPYELEEKRTVPMWLTAAGPIGPGNRWYKVRVRPQYGLMKSVGVRAFVDPADPNRALGRLGRQLQRTHGRVGARGARPARGRGPQGRVRRRAQPAREPADGQAPARGGGAGPERLEPEARREREQRESLLRELRGGDGPPASDEEYAELLRRIDEQRRIQRKGRKTTATVVAREETGRTFATIPLVLLDFDIEGRSVRFEHVYGLANAAHYQVGRQIEMWVDRKAPDRIAPGR